MKLPQHGISKLLVARLFISFRRFHDAALQLLGECYNDNEKLTKELIIYDFCTDKKNTKKRVPSLRIAVDNSNEEFVAHSSCQSLLDYWWKGVLAPGGKGMLKVKHFGLKDYLYQAKTIKRAGC